jgi:putative transposase
MLPGRKAVRLPGYDYSRAGYYFVTNCAYRNACIFGDIQNSILVPTAIGQLVQSMWMSIPEHYAHVGLDQFVLMPNHVHGIVVISKDRQLREPCGSATLGQIIGSYKAAVTRAVRQDLGFQGQLWHRGFHEHIIRNDASLARIRAYIETNPTRWGKDPEMRKKEHT